MRADSRRWVRALQRSCATRLIARRGPPKLSSRQSRLNLAGTDPLLLTKRTLGVRMAE